jgi:mRNA interferase RelE/StbE
MKIEVSEQVLEFIRTCPPEPRRWLREALRKLAEEKGDIKALDSDLEGYHRLRVRSYRIIFRYETGRNSRKIFCAFAERRSVVYETFLRLLGN